MARQQLNVRRRSVVTYVGISEHGPCGYCKFTKRAHDKAKFVTGQGDASTSLSVSPSSPLSEVPTVASSSSSTTAKTEADDANALPPNVANSQDTAADDDGSDHGNSAVFGLIAYCLTHDSFGQLLDLGWSRSGRFLYKPLMDRTCCPQYTIRLDVHKFRLSRTQKRVLRAMRDFLRSDKRPKNGRAVVNDGEGPTEGRRKGKGQTAGDKSEGTAGGDGQKQRKRRRRRGSSATTTTAQPQQQQSGTTDGMAKTNTKTKTTDALGMERQPKKKTMRRRRAEERLKARGIDLEEYKSQRAARETARRRTIQSFLDGYNEPSWAHAFELRLIGQPSLDFDQDFDEEFELFKRYQMQIHREKETDLTPDAFRRFLGSSPLFPGPPTAEGRTPDAMDNKGSGQQQQMQDGLPRRPNLGSYHQQYRLDGRLIAVAVIDLLPRCLSAKYFFYDPDYAFLSLGTYSALREIAFTQLLAQHRPDLHFYYMGFYLYDCPKMRYKSRFRPSELLCDHCFNWVPMTECERILAANGGRFSTFHPSGEPIRAQLDNAQIDQIICLYGDPPQPLTFANLRHSLSAPVSAASSSGSPHDGEEEAEMGYAPDRPSSTTSSRVVSLHQLTNEVRTFAHHAGLTALEMVLVLS